MKLFSSIIFLISTYNFCLAYEDWKPGYVVLQNGDTVRGFIDDQQWTNSPSVFRFRKSATENPLEHSTSTVTFFYLEHSKGLFFGSVMPFTSQQNKSSTISLADSRSLNFNGFLTVLVFGKQNLYRMDFEGVEYFFIKTGSAGIEQLELRKQIKNVKKNDAAIGALYGGFLPIFKQTLKNKTSDCPESQKTVELLDYTEKSLTPFV